MAKVSLNVPAPDFTRDDFKGNPHSLSDHKGEKHVVLVFNRGFM